MSRALSWVALLCTLFVAACTPELTSRTQVLLQVKVGSVLRQQADRLVVHVSRVSDAGEMEMRHEEEFELDETFPWPASLALLPKDGSSDAGFRVAASVYQGSRLLAVGRVISQFLEGKTLLLVLELPDACLGEFSCGDEETCSAKARCVSAKVSPDQLKQIHKASDVLDDAGDEPDAASDDDAALEDGGADAEIDAEPADAALDAMTEDALPEASVGEDAQADASVDISDAADGGGDAAVVCGVEDCLNGLDDDCDGDSDCADSECNVAAMCVADTSAPLVLRLPPNQACPPGYTGTRKELHRALVGGGCGGCSCGAAGATTCTAKLVAYTNSGDCINGSWTQSYDLTRFSCLQTPIWGGSFSGLGVDSIVATPGTCPASGTAQPAAARWGEDATLCTLSKRGNGCAANQVCVARPGTNKLCVESASAGSCSTGQTSELWYTSFEDTRACNACTCAASGASCAGVTVHFGNDYSCSGTKTVLGPGGKSCNGAYSPTAGMVGSAVNASCTPNASLSGSLQARGNTNLCCF